MSAIQLELIQDLKETQEKLSMALAALGNDYEHVLQRQGDNSKPPVVTIESVAQRYVEVKKLMASVLNCTGNVVKSTNDQIRIANSKLEYQSFIDLQHPERKYRP